ncbi:MAG: hypothetical protein QOE36_313 [Gaiellaceae bacterium]|nr:hypothetical protein [Gaiellaceae bacterium]
MRRYINVRRGVLVPTVAVLATLFAGVGGAGAATNLLSNGSFEGSLTGWKGWQDTIALASDGVDGPGAAKATSTGTGSYTIYTSPRPVSSSTAGTVLQGGGWVRSAVAAQTTCIWIREWASSAVASASSCITAPSTWQRFPTVSYTVRNTGDTVELYVSGSGGANGKSFEVDGLTLEQAPPAGPDTTAPTVSLTAPSDGARVSGNVALTATASDDVGVARVEFLANGTVFATDTTAPYAATWSSTGSPDGPATLAARAVDAATNSATSSRSVTVDNTAPDTTISSGPPASTTSTSASFSFSASESPATLACSLDGLAYTSCASPTSYGSLASGPHTFRVRATDGAGNTDATPATWTWTIDGPPPPPPPPPGTTPNLLQNGRFEGSLAGWSGWNATLSAVTGGTDGAGALRAARSTGTSYSALTSPRPLNPTTAGITYAAGAWVRSVVAGRKLCLTVREWSSNGSVVAAPATCLTGSSTWQQFPALTYTTSQSGGTLEVYVNQSGALAGDSFDLDGVTLRRTAPAPDQPATSGDPVLVGAGDIADCTSAGDEATSALLGQIGGTVATLGDNVYPNGSLTNFASCYDPNWGQWLPRTKPSLGNHDYNTANAAGYFGYFGGIAGDPSKGYYSYDLGTWHIVVLNSNCARIGGGCTAGSPQEQWLRSDLANHPTQCSLAYWHHPRYSSVTLSNQWDPGDTDHMKAIWQAFSDFGGDVILNGHDHLYERFAPQTPTGAGDPALGIREFIVGTGGEDHLPVGTNIAPNSEVRNGTAFGVLKLTLHASSYDWQFVPAAGAAFTDSGSTACH